MTPVTLRRGRIRKSTPHSAGYDLFSTEQILIPIGGRALISTGVYTSMNNGVVGIIKDRSGLASKQGVTVLAGVIDSDYEDEWKVVLLNTGNYPFIVNIGDRVAQVLFLHHLTVESGLEGEIEYGPDRVGGFGSTGK